MKDKKVENRKLSRTEEDLYFLMKKDTLEKNMQLEKLIKQFREKQEKEEEKKGKITSFSLLRGLF